MIRFFGIISGFQAGILFAGLTVLVPQSVSGVQIVTENQTTYCEEIHLSKLLNVYKDPTLFMGDLALITTDPQLGWERLMEENPLLTRLQGTVHLMRLGPPRYFRNFGSVARYYDAAEPHFRMSPTAQTPAVEPQNPLVDASSQIVPIQICGGSSDAYSETLGFVVTADLDAGLPEGESHATRPSTLGNPIPKIPPMIKND